MLKVLINGVENMIHTAAELERVLNNGHREQYREIWVERGGAIMCALAAEGIAWLMMIPSEGEPGFSSRNQNCSGSVQETLQFRLSNGQIDEYPVAWTLPQESWVKGMVHFAETGKLSQSIHWHDEG